MSKQAVATSPVALVAIAAVAAVLAGAPARAQPLVLQGTAFQVNTYTTDFQYRSDVGAGANGSFVVVWHSILEDGAGAGVFGRRFDAAGAPVGAAFQVNDSTVVSEGYPAVAVEPDGDFVVVWQVYGEDLRGRRFASTGAALGAEFAVNDFTSPIPARPAVASDADGDFVVVWQSLYFDANNWGIAARCFDSTGAPVTSDLQVNSYVTSYQGVPAVARDAEGRFVVVWESVGQDGSDYGIFAQRLNSACQFLGPEFQVNTVTGDDQQYPGVAMDANGDFIVAWQSRAGQDGSFLGVMARRFDSLGVPNGSELVVNSRTAGGQALPDVSAEPDGDFVVTWAGNDGGPDVGNFIRRFDSSGVAQGVDLLVAGVTDDNSQPRVATDADGDRLVVWSAGDGAELGVFARRLDAPSVLDVDGDGVFSALTDALLALRFAFGFTGAALTSGALSPSCSRCSPAAVHAYLDQLAAADPLAPAPPARAGAEFQVNAHTDNRQYNGSIGVDADGDFVVAWLSDLQDGSSSGVFARRFTVSAPATGVEFQVNSHTVNAQARPKLAIEPTGDFVVVWDSDQDGGFTGVFGRRFAASGTPLAQEFQVNVRTLGNQQYSAVAVDDDGDFVVAWGSFTQDGSMFGLFARRFGSTGAASGGEFQVSSHTLSDQLLPSVASAANGDFVMVWSSREQDGSQFGVFARRFTSAGAALASEFRVNAQTMGSQLYSEVAADADGDFVVVWWDLGAVDGDGGAVLARRFNSSGSTLATPFVVNVGTLGDQGRPDVAMDAEGDFVIAWMSDLHDPSGLEVFARRFASSGDARTGDLRVNSHTDGHHLAPRVGADASGDFVVTWSTYDGSDRGVFGQRFVVPGLLDVDANGSFAPLTDGLLIVRFAFGFTGSALTTGAVGPGCARCDAPSIAAYLTSLL